jgi:predicted tellurium resistance membrane protein TerC
MDPALLTLDSALALLTLTALEIVLGIDNIVFIAILTGRLPEAQRERARVIGLALALVMRVALLFGIFWVMRLTTPLFTVPFLTELTGEGATAVETALTVTGRDIVLVVGGLFLIAKATYEIHHMMEDRHDQDTSGRPTTSMGPVLMQIALLDVVFSLDSVITAIGMVEHIEIMVTAVLIAVAVMIVFVGSISRFVTRHPSMKTLALSFLVMIGVLLVADGLGQHLPRGYVYFAMVFSLVVELINLRAGARRRKTVTA